ncbi:MAG: hypothetical protein QF473_04285 [Planctomycetota bacterium]|jgi:DNA-directed RNA polymerase subunit RPC12/RpoP|nr:hypothetical protein [Planctomycetota bacterium]MDP6503439.1 hypothetical protein [Planctomycetota bacterium]
MDPASFNLKYVCRECGTVLLEDLSQPLDLKCVNCGNELEAHPGDKLDEKTIEHCLVCGGDDLYVRKDFKQMAGAFVVTSAVVVATIAYYYTANMLWPILVLVISAMVDAALYRFIPDMTACYRCKAEYRGMNLNPEHGNYSHYTAERYRALARQEAEAAAKEA